MGLEELCVRPLSAKQLKMPCVNIQAQAAEGTTDAFITAKGTQGVWRIAWSFFASAMGSWVITAPANYAVFAGYVGLIMYAIAAGDNLPLHFAPFLISFSRFSPVQASPWSLSLSVARWFSKGFLTAAPLATMSHGGEYLQCVMWFGLPFSSAKADGILISAFLSSPNP